MPVPPGGAQPGPVAVPPGTEAPGGQPSTTATLLPNGKVPARTVLPAAIIMGLLSEILKYSYILLLPRLNFQEVYGPFAISVSMMFWAFLSGLLLLTGAHLSAQKIFLKES